jgi:predicted TIM-barrel enzyme
MELAARKLEKYVNDSVETTTISIIMISGVVTGHSGDPEGALGLLRSYGLRERRKVEIK